MTSLPAGAIRLNGVGKRYIKYEDTPTLAYGLLHAWGRSRRSKLWAVRDLNLDVSPGEAIGVIGKNGSGKSTLLQMLCGVTAPTTGELRVSGRIAPLISVGVGFHPELTGRENIFVNGTILGLTRAQIAKRLDEIVAFSEIEDFIDTPVKFYSSGMYVRLGFSVAAHVDPDVLLIDEVLAVGDAGFQWKCFKHLLRLQEAGTTVVMVSHNMPAVERHCQRGVLMHQSTLLFDGPVRDATDRYQALLADEGKAGVSDTRGVPMEYRAIEVTFFRILGEDGTRRLRASSEEELRVRVDVHVNERINAPFLLLALVSADGIRVYEEHNMFAPFPSLSAGTDVSLEARVRLSVRTGPYTLEYTVGRGSRTSRNPWQLADDVAALTPVHRVPLFVEGRANAHGVADFPTQFTLGTLAAEGRRAAADETGGAPRGPGPSSSSSAMPPGKSAGT